MVERALAWLRSVQNADGGWGECLESYKNRALMGKGRSTASQTAWALMGLLAYLPREDAAIKRGIAWLVAQQNAAGSWDEAEYTGTGFPNHFYLRYNMYRHYFPLMALGRYITAPRTWASSARRSSARRRASEHDACERGIRARDRRPPRDAAAPASAPFRAARSARASGSRAARCPISSCRRGSPAR